MPRSPGELSTHRKCSEQLFDRYRTFAWRRSEPVHTVAARKREPNNQSHCMH
jgi:hypothetical protein